MGLFTFLKKKPQPTASGAELKIPSPQEAEAAAKRAGSSFPLLGSPAGPTLETPISAPRSLEELEIPLPARELELPRLEFPSLPFEEDIQPVQLEEKKQNIVLPTLEDLEAEVPAELPELEGEAPKPQITTAIAPIAPSSPAVQPVVQQPFPSKSALTPSPISLSKPQVMSKPKEAPKERATLEELEAPIVIRHGAGPLYMNLDGYKSVLLATEDVRDSLKRAGDRLTNLNAFKMREDSTLEAWQSSLENIQRKMVFIDRSLFERQEG